MTYDPDGFPTVAVPQFSNPNATLNNPDYSVMEIPGVNDPPGSIYAQNQVGFSKTLLINRVFNMLSKMINVLQKAAVAQANRLNVYTQWQQAYTDQMNQVHSFQVGSDDYFGSHNLDKSSTTNLQSALNTTNSTYTTQIQNRRSVISDASKSLQTNVNQTTDAVTQQTNLATSLLQELSTLTSTIFKGS